jgi:predicted nucleotidyltransferase
MIYTSKKAKKQDVSHISSTRRSKAPFKSSVDADVLKEVVRKIVEAFRPERIILFGSHAYGAPAQDSDVDLLVIMDTKARPAERSARIAKVCRPRYLAMDILVRTPEEIDQRLKGFDPFLEEILTRGKVLYEAPR